MRFAHSELRMLKEISSAQSLYEQLREQVLDLLWSLWAEVGVPGWSRRHEDWAIDPEPLIVFTPYLGDGDSRLGGESINWCIRNARYIAATRLRNILSTTPEAVRQRWGPY